MSPRNEIGRRRPTGRHLKALLAGAAYAAGSKSRELASDWFNQTMVPRPLSNMPITASKQLVRKTKELKNIDLTAAFAALTDQYTGVLLNPCAQGGAGENRTGREVLFEDCELRMQFSGNSNAPFDLIRVIVLYDKESRGGSPAIGDVLSQPYTASQTQQINSSWNFDNVGTRFKPLLDKTINLNALYSADVVSHSLDVRFPIKLKARFYNTNAGNVTDFDFGAITMLVMGYQPVNFSSFSYDSRVTFRDV
jgi:hypothetical protein